MRLTERQLRRLIQEQVNKQIIKEAFELTKAGELAVKAAMKVLFFPIKFIPWIGVPLYIALSWSVEKIIIIISSFMLGTLSEENMFTRIQNLMFVTVDKVIKLDSKFSAKMKTGLDAFVAGIRMKHPKLNDIYEDDFGEDGDKMVFALWLTSRIINIIAHKKFAFIKFNRKMLPLDFQIIDGLGRLPTEPEVEAAKERLRQAGFDIKEVPEEWSEEVETIDITPEEEEIMQRLLVQKPDTFDIESLQSEPYYEDDPWSDDTELLSIDDDEEDSWEDDIELMSIDDDETDEHTAIIMRSPIKENLKLQRVLKKVFAN